MSLSFPAYFLHLKHPFVKIRNRNPHNKLKDKTLSITAWHLWQQKEKNSCNARVRVRAKEKREGGYKYFYISKSWLIDCVSLWCFFTSERAQKTTRHFDENNTSFYEKQALVLSKTTRCFEENKPSFYENKPSLYTKVPLMETKKKSSRHNLHKYKHKEDYWRTKAKELCRKQEKRCRKTKEKQWGYCKAKKAFTPYLPKKSLLK